MRAIIKIVSVLLSVILVMSVLVACTSASANEANEDIDTQLQNKGIVESADAITNQNLNDDDYDIMDDDMFTRRDLDSSYDKKTAVNIELTGNSAKASSNSVSINDSIVTITKEGTYIVSGELTNGQIIVDISDNEKAQLVLDSANINSDSSAAIYVKQADKVFITLAEGSKNELSNKSEFVEIDENNINSVVFSKDDLTLNGNGELKINASFGNGISSKDDLVIASGIYDITSAGHAIKGKDSVRIADGTFAITSQKDAIHSENTEKDDKGFTYIRDGVFEIGAESDGIDAEEYLQIDGGNFNIKSGGGSENTNNTKTNKENFDGMAGRGNFGDFSDEDRENMKNARGKRMPFDPNNNEENEVDSNSTPVSATADGGLEIKQFTANAENSADNSQDTNNESQAEDKSKPNLQADRESDNNEVSKTSGGKGLKSLGMLIINGGTFIIDSADDAIHSNDTITINEGEFEIKAGDDGVHADEYLHILDGKINIETCYEGIESKVVEISGSTIDINAIDDGINASSGNGNNSTGDKKSNPFEVTEGALIKITGGVVNITASGDSIDSNGDIEVSGGEIYLQGPASGPDAAFDYDGTAKITGGTVFGVGTSQMAQNFGSESTQGSILYNLSSTIDANTEVALQDSAGNEIVSFKPDRQFSSILISHAEIIKGEKYTITVGSDNIEIEMTDIIYGSGFSGDMRRIRDNGSEIGERPDGMPEIQGGEFPEGFDPENMPDRSE